MSRSGRPGVLLMTYGSPASLDREDIRTYLTRVRGGREPEPELVDEFTRRYQVIGGSPLIEITREQAAALADALDWPVEVGMRFSEPSILAGLRALAEAGVSNVASIIMSPQYSPLLMSGYERDVRAARAALGDREIGVEIAGPWYRQPAFLAAVSERIQDGLERVAPNERATIPVLLTAHSLPRRVAEQEPDYLAQLLDTAEMVAALAGLDRDRWMFCWQSAGHEPGEWMKPDFADLIPTLRDAGHRSVLVAPIQFLADHLEILYDIDIAARQQAEAAGLRFARIASLNVSSRFIDALAAVATSHNLGHVEEPVRG